MLEGMISSKTRVNILVKLFLNPGTESYLRELASEFSVSTNAVRMELSTLTKHRFLKVHRKGRQVLYRANPSHPLFPELSSMVRKLTGIDSLVRSIVDRLGNLEKVYLTGDYARGKDSGIIDIVLVGKIKIDQLDDIVKKTEKYIDRKIRPFVLDETEFQRLSRRGSFQPIMLLWQKNSSPSANYRYG